MSNVIAYFCRSLFAPAVALLLAGCSGNSTMGDVQGEVTLDGTPLAKGAVRFIPLDGKSATAGALIENGTFATQAPIARHRVEIVATEVRGATGKVNKFSNQPAPEVVQLIPERYNAKSELTWDVQAGVNERRFDLESH